MMMVIISMAAFAAGAAVAGLVLVGTDWRRVLRVLRDGPDQHRLPDTDPRWRRVHIDADARAPFTSRSR